MQAWQATVQDDRGNAVPNPIIHVYESDGVTEAEIFDEAGNPLPNPYTGTIDGFAQFWAVDGDYKIRGSKGSGNTELWSVTLDTTAQRAVEAADRAEDAADRAEGVVAENTTQFQTRADFLAATVSDDVGIIEFLAGNEAHSLRRSVGGPIAQINGQTWAPAGKVALEMFSDAWTVDAAPGLRAARTYLTSIGGGTIYLAPKEYPLTSIETMPIWSIGGGGVESVTTKTSCFWLSAGISIQGVTGKSKLRRASGGVDTILNLLSWTGALRGFEIEGAGSTNNSHHAITADTIGTASSSEFVMDGAIIEDLYIHHVGSYGIGLSQIQKNCKLRRLRVEFTGADGIDWKVRGSSFNAVWGETSGNSINDVIIRSPAQREAVRDNSSGLGIRGQAQVSNVQVLGILDNCIGINFQPGTGNGSDFRESAGRSTLDNFYCEAVNPLGNAIGVDVWTCGSVIVGTGKCVGCRVRGRPVTSTPYADFDAPTFSGVIVYGLRGGNAFETFLTGTHFNACRALSEKQYFGGKRGNTTAGQTVLPIEHTTATGADGSALVVLKNGTQLTLTTDYTIQSGTITLTSGLLLTDEVIVVFPVLRAIRIEADYCVVTGGGCDRFVSNGVSHSTSEFINNGSVMGFLWEGKPGITQIPDSTTAILSSSGVAGTNLQTQARDSTGRQLVNRAAIINTPTAATGMASGTLWTNGTEVNRVP